MSDKKPVTKKWNHQEALSYFNEAKVICVSLDGVHLAIEGETVKRRIFNKHNLRKKTADKIFEIINNDFIQLPENPTATFGRLFLRTSVVSEIYLGYLNKKLGIEENPTENEEPAINHITVHDLMRMTEGQRNLVMEKAFSMAAENYFDFFDDLDLPQYNKETIESTEDFKGEI